jgi:hypothetical protein
MANPYLMALRDQAERCFRALVPQGERPAMPLERFDRADARRTDRLLGRS